MSRRLTPRAFVPLAAFAIAPLAWGQAQEASRPNQVSSSLDTLLADWQGQFGTQWHMRANRLTGTLEMLYGGKAAVGFEPRIGKDSDWFTLTRHWVDQTHAMHGVYGMDLVDDRVVFLPLAQVNTTDKLTVALRQEIQGVPVEDGRVNALYTPQGELLSLHSTAAPRIENRSTKPSIDAQAATLNAMRAFMADVQMEPVTVRAPQLVFAHVDDQETRRWTLAWQVDVQNTTTLNPVGHLYTVDARTGQILKQSDTVHFFDVSGTLFTKATPGLTADRAANPPVNTPMPYARITSSAGTVITDANGNFNYPGVNTALNLTVEYYGNFTDANNDQGADYTITFNAVQPNVANNLVMNNVPTEFVTSQANAYLSIATLRDWIRERIPSDATADFRGAANCNLASTCNAFYDGVSTNYYAAGGGCNNTGFSSVVAHEVGHWLNSLYGTGNGGDGIGEGNADVFALYLYDDPILGSFFFTSGGFVRTGNNTRQYCGDGNGGCYGGVHADGEPWMGAAWNIRQYLNTALGNTTGDLTADLLFLSWMNSYNQTTINSIIETQWLTLDDNNGNINDGTPNYASIDQGFVDQGFPGFNLPFVTFANPVAIADTRDEVGPYAAQIDMFASFNPPVASGSVFYRINGAGAWNSVPMTNTSGNTWVGNIPGIASPSTVQYYFRGTDSTGGNNEYPAGGASEPLSFRIGTLTSFLFNNFEGATNEGWTGGAAGDTATTGIWTRGNPLGTAAQPEDDHSAVGTNCWFTGQGTAGGAVGENDVDGGTTTLLSPTFNALGLTNGKISYWRWYSNDTGSAPNADTFVVSLSGNNGSTWSTVETVGPNGAQASGGWFQHTFTISSIMTPTANMRLRFVASDTGSGSIIEAAVDDIEGFSLEPSSAILGTHYCDPAVPNSTAFPASISAMGSINVADNEVQLQAFNLPPNQFAYFLNGTLQAFVPNPGGSAGNLCLGGSLGRYNQISQIFNSGFFGTGTLDLDLTTTPSASGVTSILAGQSWNFQCWYRDTANVTSNFTDAINIQF